MRANVNKATKNHLIIHPDIQTMSKNLLKSSMGPTGYIIHWKIVQRLI